MSHDYEAQRAETFATFVELRQDADLPAMAVVHFLFYAEDMDPDWGPVEKALQAKGFTTRREVDEGMLEASIGPIAVTPESIWQFERQSTEIALRSDFYPDGWDMLAD
ncbi:MAG: hypothetical protein U1D35_15050 [Paracoccaceae bacterium]|nr:hypothetical protein [Paracoccaceae bacterium]